MAGSSPSIPGNAARSARAEAGRTAERLAREYLVERGLSILDLNYRCRAGEVDIVARDGDAVVFVEVRLRRNPAYGGAAESIDAAKRRRLVSAARHYALRARLDCPMRFDAVLLDALDSRRIEWLRDVMAE